MLQRSAGARLQGVTGYRGLQATGDYRFNTELEVYLHNTRLLQSDEALQAVV